jgi:ATP-binding cassette, subfamily B, bacterial PglK
MYIKNNYIKLKNFLSHDQKKNFNYFIILSFLAMIFEILSISLIIPLINIFVQGDAKIPYINLNYSTEITIFIFLLIFLLIFSIKNLFLVYFEKKKHYFIYELRTKVSEKIYSSYIFRDFSFHLKHNSSILIRNINDISHVLAITRSWIILLSEVLVVLGITIFLISYDPYITILAIIILSGLGFIFHTKIQIKAKKWGEDRQYHDGFRLIKLNEGFGAIKDIKLFSKEKYFIDQFSSHNKNSALSEFYHSFVQSLPRLIFEWLLVFCVIILVFSIIYQGKDLDYALSIMSLFLVASLRFMPSITRIMNSLQLIRYSAPALETVTENLKAADEKENYAKTNNSSQKIFFKDKLEINNVSFSFPEKKDPILLNFSCEIKVGSKIGIIGESGSGKTTLINLVTGLLTPEKGEILVDKKDITLNRNNWQNLIGYVPQNIFLLDDTLLRNIALGCEDKDIDIQKVKEIIKITKLSKLVNKSQNNIYAKMGELGEKISGGERQRLGIARALYKNPELLILDESTSALDLSTEKEIINDIHNIMQGKTIIIVSHRKNTLEKCDSIFNLNSEREKKI